MSVLPDGCGGIGGGRGAPSATSVLASIKDDWGGIGGGSGAPSARSVRSIIVGLPAKVLTEPITGSTIRIARTETAMTSVGFFKGIALLKGILRRSSHRDGCGFENVP